MAKRVTLKISDQQLLNLMDEGVITVRRMTAKTPTVYKGRRKLAVTVVGSRGKNGERPRVEICHQKGKRSIVLHKLVWMFHHRRLVPVDHQIHHIDEDRWNCSIDNLEILDHEQHARIHNYSTLKGEPLCYEDYY